LLASPGRLSAARSKQDAVAKDPASPVCELFQ
jgi:hypothetical protein